MSVQSGSTTGRAIAEAMLREFEQELGTTRRFLQRLPQGQADVAAA